MTKSLPKTPKIAVLSSGTSQPIPSLAPTHSEDLKAKIRALRDKSEKLSSCELSQHISPEQLIQEINRKIASLEIEFILTYGKYMYEM